MFQFECLFIDSSLFSVNANHSAIIQKQFAGLYPSCLTRVPIRVSGGAQTSTSVNFCAVQSFLVIVFVCMLLILVE